MSAKTYDAIVVGSVLGGLTAGALYARAGYRVLILERNADCPNPKTGQYGVTGD